MTDATKAANVALDILKVVRLAELALDMLEQSNIAVAKVVEMRAKAKREGRDNLSEGEMNQLFESTQEAIDSIL